MNAHMTHVPSELELSIDDERTVELPGLGTAGYVWDHEIVGDDDVIDVEWTRGVPPGSPVRPVGSSAPEAVRVRALRPGQVTLRLYHHRRWEPPDLARAEYRVSIVVHRA